MESETKCSQSEAHVLRRGLCKDCTELNQKMIEVPSQPFLKSSLMLICLQGRSDSFVKDNHEKVESKQFLQRGSKGVNNFGPFLILDFLILPNVTLAIGHNIDIPTTGLFWMPKKN